MEKQFLRVLPFYLQPILDDPDLEIPMPAALWKCFSNHCEGSGSRCDDSAGLYYSITGDAVTWWCPRHWYEICIAPDAPYRLLDMTAEQYRQECQEQKQRFTENWQTVSKRIESSASILSDCGLEEEANKLWQAHGWIRSSIDGK